MRTGSDRAIGLEVETRLEELALLAADDDADLTARPAGQRDARALGAGDPDQRRVLDEEALSAVGAARHLRAAGELRSLRLDHQLPCVTVGRRIREAEAVLLADGG